MATIRSLMQKDQNLTRLCIVFLAVFIICTVLKGTLFLSVNNFQSMGKQFPEFRPCSSRRLCRCSSHRRRMRAP